MRRGNRPANRAGRGRKERMDYRDLAKDLLVHRNEYITARESLANEIELLAAEK